VKKRKSGKVEKLKNRLSILQISSLLHLFTFSLFQFLT